MNCSALPGPLVLCSNAPSCSDLPVRLDDVSGPVTVTVRYRVIPESLSQGSLSTGGWPVLVHARDYKEFQREVDQVANGGPIIWFRHDRVSLDNLGSTRKAQVLNRSSVSLYTEGGAWTPPLEKTAESIFRELQWGRAIRRVLYAVKMSRHEVGRHFAAQSNVEAFRDHLLAKSHSIVGAGWLLVSLAYTRWWEARNEAECATSGLRAWLGTRDAELVALLESLVESGAAAALPPGDYALLKYAAGRLEAIREDAPPVEGTAR